MTATIGELCAGYGGLGMGVSRVIDAEVAWYSEIDKGALKVLGHRFPGVPNVGDMTAADWSTVPPVDILTGGTPCQDLSHAGKRAGMTEGTRSNLWVAMREAIAQLRPKLVIWENVRGAYSASADSALESDPRLLADVRRRDGEPVLRALGRVLGDLSELGYVGGWHGLRAADVGAPHGRFRVFVVAADAECGGLDGWAPVTVGRSVGGVATAWGGEAARNPAAADAPGPGLGGLRWVDALGRDADGRGRADGPGATGEPAALLPTPVADHSRGLPSAGTDYQSLPNAVCALLPTPAVNDMGAAYTPDEWDAWTDRMKAEHGNGNGHGKSLSIEAARLLPTPTATEGRKGDMGETATTRREAGHEVYIANALAEPDRWGDYADAIARWEHTLGRPAPEPTMTSTKGNPQLAPTFVEWMMGLPAGWVTDVPGITRNEALKALGNGVVPQQAAAAVSFLLDVVGERVAA